MSFFRTASTRRLLATGLGAVAAAVAGVAVASGTGAGPLPPAKPLAVAVHDAITAPAVDGVTARIEFKNHLIDSSSLNGSNPLLSGASGRLWMSGERFRLELQSSRGDAQIVSDGATVSVYDASNNTVYRAALPASKDTTAKTEGPPTLAAIEKKLTKLMEHASISSADPSSVAGRPTYTVRVGPKHDGGLLGAAELAWDADHGVPLRAAVYAQGNSSPVLELKATDISFGAVPASRFDVSPPSGVKTVTLDTGSKTRAAGHEKTDRPAVTGPAAVAKSVTFQLSAPATLVGLPRQEVRKLDFHGHPAALVTYGKGLGGIAVIEQASDPKAAADSSTGKGRREGRQLSLPTVSIDGVTGQELDTALGTMVRFSRGGVDYTVIGSVPPAAAEAAARAI
jgi:outer membrane lipoprotein-sorting protein